MRQTLTTLALLLFFFNSIFSQTCPTGRYYSEIFTSSRTMENVNYISVPSLIPACTEQNIDPDLDYALDVYEPDNDDLTKRPVIVFAHGGAFAIGWKQQPPVTDYCYEMANRGFVVISIDYRKCIDVTNEDHIIRSVYRTIQDMNAAVRWTKANSNTLNVDTNKIILAGTSAGAIMAMQAAFSTEAERAVYVQASYAIPPTIIPPYTGAPDLGCINCGGNNLTNTNDVAMVFNFWGAILDTAGIETTEPIPVYSVHGDQDIIVFPGVQQPFNWPVFPNMYGIFPIHERLTNLGVANDYTYLLGEGHEPWLLDNSSGAQANFDTIVSGSSYFAYNVLLKPPTPNIIGLNSPCIGTIGNFNVEQNDPDSYYCWDVSGGTIVAQNTNSSAVQIQWNTLGTQSISVFEVNCYEADSDIKTINRTVVNCADCITNLNISNPIPNGLYSADNNLTSDGQVPLTGNVIFRAGNKIRLNAGFETSNDCDFDADIENCRP